jgi:hypothetical protein
MLHKGGKNAVNNKFRPKEGQGPLLCSNRAYIPCPSLGFTNEEDQAIDCLADILVEAFIKKKKNEFKNIK